MTDPEPKSIDKFTTGSTMRHVVVMTLTASFGMMVMFAVDLVDLYFLSLLGEPQIAAAVGFSGSILFFTTAVSIGIMIAMSALVSRSLGAKDEQQAKDYMVNAIFLGLLCSILIVLTALYFLEDILIMVGAKGQTLRFAIDYLTIVLPSLPFLVLAMSMVGVLRSMGMPAFAMYATLIGGAVNAILDPILIFGFDLDIKGAAWASVCSRMSIASFAIWAVVFKNSFITGFHWNALKRDAPEIFKIALPSILTNLATPVGGIFIMTSLAQYGDSVVAGYSVIGRIIPVAFALVFGLSSAVGPIVAQNYGAEKTDRIVRALRDAIIFSSASVMVICICLFTAQSVIVSAFGLQGEAADLLRLYCTYICFAMVFKSIIFICNASFNNLGYPTYSTAVNFCATFLGTIPFVTLGSYLYGAHGILIFEALGVVLFSGVAFTMLRKVILAIGDDKGKRDELSNAIEYQVRKATHIDACSSPNAKILEIANRLRKAKYLNRIS